jgi:SAM-dependent MidA family methyltransferase
MSNFPHSELLREIISEQISLNSQQRITFAQYMDLVLYHPRYGYYSSGQVSIGAEGDFFTSSSLGADFGQLWAEQFLEIAEILGFPKPFYLVEVGAGLGYFANDVLNYLREKSPTLYNSLAYIVIENCQILAEKQKSFLENHHHVVSWKTWEEIENNSLIGCIFSNELIDAFPVHQVIFCQGKLKEIYLNNQLQEVIAPLSTNEILEYFELISINISSENYRTEVNLAALDWLKSVANKLKKGFVITVDYGYSAQKYYHPQRHQGTLQCYWQHQRHNDPYRYLGYQDITTHVNFTALEKQGAQVGLETVGFTKQGMALMALGLGDKLAELSTGKYDLPKILQRRDALHQLIDPAGLGNFGVLIQGKDISTTLRALQQY